MIKKKVCFFPLVQRKVSVPFKLADLAFVQENFNSEEEE